MRGRQLKEEKKEIERTVRVETKKDKVRELMSFCLFILFFMSPYSADMR